MEYVVLEVYTLVVTPFGQNARVLYDAKAQQALVIDPGGDVERIVNLLAGLDVSRVEVLLTHAHIDHAGGVEDCLAVLTERYTSTIALYAHRDGSLRGSVAQQAAVFGLPLTHYKNVPEPTQCLDDGDVLRLGEHEARVLWTPGHAPDHISLFFPETDLKLREDESAELRAPLLIAGDTLFAGSIGRTDLPGGSYPQLLASIKDKLLELPPTTVVASGHGPSTTIAQERSANPFLQ